MSKTLASVGDIDMVRSTPQIDEILEWKRDDFEDDAMSSSENNYRGAGHEVDEGKDGSIDGDDNDDGCDEDGDDNDDDHDHDNDEEGGDGGDDEDNDDDDDDDNNDQDNNDSGECKVDSDGENMSQHTDSGEMRERVVDCFLMLFKKCRAAMGCTSFTKHRFRNDSCLKIRFIVLRRRSADKGRCSHKVISRGGGGRRRCQRCPRDDSC